MKEQKDRYEIFLKVCETGSFSKAAEALNYTQSGISQMMAGLEEELGVQLFARVKRGVSCSPHCRWHWYHSPWSWSLYHSHPWW